MLGMIYADDYSKVAQWENGALSGIQFLSRSNKTLTQDGAWCLVTQCTIGVCMQVPVHRNERSECLEVQDRAACLQLHERLDSRGRVQALCKLAQPSHL